MRAAGTARILLLLAGTIVVSACGGGGGPDLEISPSTVDADRLLFERGQDSLAAEQWLDAREYFLQVRDNYPQSPLRADARLGVADSYEGGGSSAAYVSAIAEYQDFIALYPTHPRAGYAKFKLALVHHHQMRGPERDQSWTRSAISEFEAFLDRYPNSEYREDAERSLRESRDRLSESEYIIGRYYYGRKWWPGAIDRLRVLEESDPEYSGREAVLFFLADALYQNRDLVEALPLFQRLVEQFPGSLYMEEVRTAVDAIERQLAEADAADSPGATDDADPDLPSH